MNVLLTGGAGYVGSACLRHLAGKGHGVVAYDDLRKGHKEAVAGYPLVEGDILDSDLLKQTLQTYDIDSVMHFAAATDVGESVSCPEYHYANNVWGTLSLLNAMREVGVDRLLFSSTCAVYGESQTEPMSEETNVDPCSPYARSKLTVEWLIKDFAEAHSVGFTLLRYFNAAGAEPEGRFGEDHRPEHHLIPLVLQVCLGQREQVQVYGDDYGTPDGTCVRDYVHVDDLARAHLMALENTSRDTREIFNVGTGKGHSVLEVIDACSKLKGADIPYVITERRPGDAPVLVARADKIRSQLGWTPRYESIDAITETAWRWHRAHPEGYPD